MNFQDVEVRLIAPQPDPQTIKIVIAILKHAFSGFGGNSKRMYRASLGEVAAPVPTHTFPQM